MRQTLDDAFHKGLGVPPLAADIHAQVLALLDQHPSLKSSLLQEQLKITPSQASKVLKELVESGQLRAEGKGKGMIYLAETSSPDIG